MKSAKSKAKSWVLRFRKIDRSNFLALKDGSKPIETRAATDKYRRIVKGDTLIIVCGKERVEKKVRRVKIFSSLKSLPRKQIMPWTKNYAEMERAYYSYPGYKEKIKKHGIIAFWL
jgi:ASC-1-like (ASCH) protein